MACLGGVFGLLLAILLVICYIISPPHILVQKENHKPSALESILQRKRRNAPTEMDSAATDGGNEDILSPTNIAKIKDMFRNDIDQLIERLVNEKLEQHLMKMKNNFQCACPGMRGEAGPPGPIGSPGPPGPQGERGLGLHPPRLTHQLLNRTAVAGNGIRFSCRFFGNPLPTTNWTNIPSRARVQTKVDRERSEIETELLFENVTWEDHGSLTCHAWNLFGKVNGTGSLTVLAPPIMHLPQRTLIGILGMTMDFPECKIVSVPEFNVTWERGFLPFPAGRTYHGNGTLRIRNLRIEDEGYYKCVAVNCLGTTTKIIHLRIKPLHFLTQPKYYEYVSSGSKRLVCSALGPRHKLSGGWYNVIDGQRLPLSRTFQKGDVFVLSSVVRKSGRYRCEISNGVTKVESYTEVDMLHLNSSILNSTNIHTVGTWLRDINSIGKYKLCWSSSRDGFNHSVFYSQCAWKPNSLSLFKNNNGAVFGGYTDSFWRKTRSSQSKVLTSCGGTIKEDTEIRYEHHGRTSCSWFINNMNPVMLNFTRFEIPCRCGTYLIIESDGKRIGRYCGNEKPTALFLTRGAVSIETKDSCYGRNANFYKIFTVFVKEMDYGYSSRSFLFSFFPTPLKLPVKSNDKAICHLHGYEPCFGEHELMYHNGVVKVDIGRSYKSYDRSSYRRKSSSRPSYQRYLTLFRNGSLNRHFKQSPPSMNSLKGEQKLTSVEVYYKV